MCSASIRHGTGRCRRAFRYDYSYLLDLYALPVDPDSSGLKNTIAPYFGQELHSVCMASVAGQRAGKRQATLARILQNFRGGGSIEEQRMAQGFFERRQARAAIDPRRAGGVASRLRQSRVRKVANMTTRAQQLTVAEQPTVEERWQEHEMLLEVFKMCSWGGLEIYVELPLNPGEVGTLYLQATALPPDEMAKPADDRRTVATVMAFDVHYGAPPLVEEKRLEEELRQRERLPVA